MEQRSGPRRRPERGAAAVEFALIVPILLTLVFGVISYGYMLSFRQALSQSAAESARAAAITPGGISNPDLLARARRAVGESLGSYGVACSASQTLTRGSTTVGTCKVELTATCSTGSTAPDPATRCVRVTLDYQYRDHSLLPDVGFGYVMPRNLSYVSEVQVA